MLPDIIAASPYANATLAELYEVTAADIVRANHTAHVAAVAHSVANYSHATSLALRAASDTLATLQARQAHIVAIIRSLA